MTDEQTATDAPAVDAVTPPKRKRGRPRKEPGAPSRPPTAAEIAQRKAAAAARWGGRGKSIQISVDISAAAALACVPERDRRRVASEAIRAAVAFYEAHRDK